MFAPDARLELIEGEIVEMAPIDPPHAACVSRRHELLVDRASDAFPRCYLPFWTKQHTLPPMQTIDATELKTNLGGVLARAAVDTLAVRKHGRIVAYLVPAREVEQPRQKRRRERMPRSLSRAQEERLLELAASGDTRPSRWRRAGPPQLLAGLAALLGSLDLGNRERLLALAEQLWPGMSTLEVANEWLRRSPIKADRFVPMLRARLAQRRRRR